MPDVIVVGTPTSSGNSTNATSRQTAVPSGTLAGDYAVCVLDRWFGSNTNPAVTFSGFTPIDFGSSSDNAAKIHGFYKKLTAPDTGFYTASWTGSAFAVLRCIVLRNVIDTGDPIIGPMQKVSGSFGAVTSMSLPAAIGDALIWALYNDNTSTHTPPTGYIEDIDVDCSALAHRIATTAGVNTASGGSASVAGPAAAIFFGFKRMPDSGSTATFAATLPELAADIDGTSRAAGAFVATMPALTSDVDGTSQSTSSLAATLPAATSQFAATSTASGQLAGTVAALLAEVAGQATATGGLTLLFADLVADNEGSATSAGEFDAQLSSIEFAATGSIETEGATLSAGIPELTADFEGILAASGLFAATLPAPVADVDGTVADLPVAVLAAELPGLAANLSGTAVVFGSLDAEVPELHWFGGGEFESNADGELEIVLPELFAGRMALKGYRSMEVQRKLTRAFIASSPIFVALVPVNEERKPSGGVSLESGVPRPVQMLRLIPMSHTEQPVTSTSASASADSGKQRRYDYTLLGEWDAVIKINDHWDTEDGQTLVVEALVSYNGYERKALIVSYGKSPFHV